MKQVIPVLALTAALLFQAMCQKNLSGATAQPAAVPGNAQNEEGFASSHYPCLLSMSGPMEVIQTADTYSRIRRHQAPDNARFDARELQLLQQTVPNRLGSPYPVDIRASHPNQRMCWAGGTILNTNPRGISWRQSKDVNSAGILAKEGYPVIEGVRLDNVHDGIRPWHRSSDGVGLSGFEIRNSWLSYVRDDCIENDSRASGVVENNLFDGCYVFLSAKGAETTLTAPDRRLIVRGNLIRLQKMPGPYGHSDTNISGHGSLFKFDAESPQLFLEDNIILIEGLPVTQFGPTNWRKNAAANLSLHADTSGSCKNNTIIWLGGGPFPGHKNLDPDCAQVTTNLEIWNEAVAEWKARHLHLARSPNTTE